MRASQRYYYRLMSNSMPGFVDPYKMAKKQQALQGTVAVASMLRVTKLLASDDGELAYSLLFDVDADDCCYISGKLEGKLLMNCQRCLQDFWHEIDCSFKVSPVPNDEAAKELASDYEPVIIEDAKLDPAELLEEELILVMPIVAMHHLNDKSCKETAKILEDKVQESTNPFRVLQELKLKKNGQQAGDKNGSTTES